MNPFSIDPVAEGGSRSEVRLAVAGSFLVHLLVFSIMVLGWKGLRQPPRFLAPSTPKILITFEKATPAPALEKERQTKQQYIDTQGLEKKEAAPEVAAFYSDTNTHAASEVLPDGDLPLPTQKGIELPGTDMVEQEYLDGESEVVSKQGQASAPENISPSAQLGEAAGALKQSVGSSQDANQQPERIPKSLQKQALHSQDAENLSAEQKPLASEDLALLEASPQLRKPRLLEAEESDNLESVEPAEASQPVEAVHFADHEASDEQQRQNQLLRQQQQRAEAGAESSYRPEKRVKNISGSISNFDDHASVDAEGSLMGEYESAISRAIGKLWHRYTRNDAWLFKIGTVKVHFYVDALGKVHRLRVVSNSSNEVFATNTIRSIYDADLPQMPAEIAKTLENEQMEVDYTFTIY